MERWREQWWAVLPWKTKKHRNELGSVLGLIWTVCCSYEGVQRCSISWWIYVVNVEVNYLVAINAASKYMTMTAKLKLAPWHKLEIVCPDWTILLIQNLHCYLDVYHFNHIILIFWDPRLKTQQLSSVYFPSSIFFIFGTNIKYRRWAGRNHEGELCLTHWTYHDPRKLRPVAQHAKSTNHFAFNHRSLSFLSFHALYFWPAQQWRASRNMFFFPLPHPQPLLI